MTPDIDRKPPTTKRLKDGGLQVRLERGVVVTQQGGKLTVEYQAETEHAEDGGESDEMKLANALSAIKPLLAEAVSGDAAFRESGGWLSDIQNNAHNYPEADNNKHNYEIACCDLYKLKWGPMRAAEAVINTDESLYENIVRGRLDGETMAVTLARSLAKYYPDKWRDKNPDYDPRK